MFKWAVPYSIMEPTYLEGMEGSGGESRGGSGWD